MRAHTYTSTHTHLAQPHPLNKAHRVLDLHKTAAFSKMQTDLKRPLCTMPRDSERAPSQWSRVLHSALTLGCENGVGRNHPLLYLMKPTTCFSAGRQAYVENRVGACTGVEQAGDDLRCSGVMLLCFGSLILRLG